MPMHDSAGRRAVIVAGRLPQLTCKASATEYTWCPTRLRRVRRSFEAMLWGCVLRADGHRQRQHGGAQGRTRGNVSPSKAPLMTACPTARKLGQRHPRLCSDCRGKCAASTSRSAVAASHACNSCGQARAFRAEQREMALSGALRMH